MVPRVVIIDQSNNGVIFAPLLTDTIRMLTVTGARERNIVGTEKYFLRYYD